MSLSITPTLILQAAQKRGWKVDVLSERHALLHLQSNNGSSYYLHGITSNKSGALNSYIAEKKDVFYQLVQELGATVPATLLSSGNDRQNLDFLAKHKRIVVKPTNQAHGKGITLNITTEQELHNALQYAAKFSTQFLLQQQVEGDDVRLLFIGGGLAAAAIRKPAYITGDGVHSIDELITLENDSAGRRDGYQNVPTTIDATAAARYLGSQLHDVPAAGVEVQVIGVANIGRGGVAIDITDTIDETLVATAKKIVNHFDMGLCGIDFIMTKTGEAYMLEVNTSPSLGLHEFPFSGKARNTPDKFLDWLSK